MRSSIVRNDKSAAGRSSAAAASLAPSSTNSAAMNLYQKFSEMQRSIDTTQKERETLQQQIENCEEEQQRLRQTRHDERNRRHQENDHAATFDEKVTDLQQKYLTEVQPAHTAASMAKENVLLQLGRWKEYKAAAHQTFLEDSREFRSKCKRLRMTASMMGLNHASIEAVVYAQSGGDKVESQIFGGGFDEQDDDDATIEYENYGTDPSTWPIPPNDDEFQDLFAIYSTKKSDYQAAQTELEGRKQVKQESVDKESRRTQRIQMLQKQLDRIHSDNADLESQIQDLETSTEEAKCMASGLSNEIASHRQMVQSQSSSTVTPSPRLRNSTNSTTSMHNPYARSKNSWSARNTTSAASSSSAARRSSSGGGGRSRSDLQAIVLGKSSLTSSRRRGTNNAIMGGSTSRAATTSSTGASYHYHQQQTHHRRRFRRDKQFGSNLQIEGGHHHYDDDDTAEQQDYAAGAPFQHDDDDQDDSSTDEYVHQADSGEADVAAGNNTGTTSNIRGGSDQQDLFDDDDDDDDDDALLSYVAFSK